jgi:hypothetical protein
MLFSQTKVTGLFCFENRQIIFEVVDSRFKFVVLTFEKDSTTTELRITETVAAFLNLEKGCWD